jgi:hypothetical protein
MNHYDAVQLADGRWHYARLSKRGGGPAGYCREHPEGHETEDGARECFWTYLVDGAHEQVYTNWTGCRWEGCDQPTKKGLAARPPLGDCYPLCDAHRTHGHLADLIPVPGQVVASY